MTTEQAKKMEKLGVYIDDAMKVSIGMKGYMLSQNNMHGYVSAQSAIDVLLDIKSIMDGGVITSIAEITKAMEKAESEKKVENGGDIYS
jgi:hypothetical protein